MNKRVIKKRELNWQIFCMAAAIQSLSRNNDNETTWSLSGVREYFQRGIEELDPGMVTGRLYDLAEDIYTINGAGFMNIKPTKSEWKLAKKYYQRIVLSDGIVSIPEMKSTLTLMR